MKRIDLRHSRDLFRVVPVVREGVVRIRYADLVVGSRAGFTRELERDDPGDVALQSEHLQVEHQTRVIRIGRRYTDRPIQIRQAIVSLGLRFLNAALDLADGVQILADPRTIGRSELLREASDIIANPIEQAGPSPQRGVTVGRAAALAEQALENDSRMGLRWKRRRWRRP